jgi:hypothetical protein
VKINIKEGGGGKGDVKIEIAEHKRVGSNMGLNEN